MVGRIVVLKGVESKKTRESWFVCFFPVFERCCFCWVAFSEVVYAGGFAVFAKLG